MKKNIKSYVSMAQAKEKIYSTLYIIDNDMHEWTELQKSFKVNSKVKEGKKNQQRDDLMAEFQEFFTRSNAIRKQLTTYLQLFNSISEN